MSVLEGEGTTVILYGSTNVPTGARNHDGYLARPDLMGEWPTVVVASPSYDAASSVKAICRDIARHGIAAVAPRSGGMKAFIGFITNTAGHWSNAEFGFGMLALGDAAASAVADAAASDLVVSLALIDPVLTGDAVAALAQIDVPVLGCSGRAASDGVTLARSAAPQAEWVIYGDAGVGYWNVDAEGYVPTAAEDTEERVIEFFERTLPPRV